MVLPAVIEKKEPAKIHRVEKLHEPELQFTSSMAVEFEETEPDLYELIVTGSTMEVIESFPEPEPNLPVTPPVVPSVYNDPFFNAYFKR